jgi:hypothetical protein
MTEITRKITRVSNRKRVKSLVMWVKHKPRHNTTGIMAYRFRQLVPERPKLEHFERWYAAISARPAFKDHVSSIALV